MNKSMAVLMLLVLAVSLCHAEETKTEYAVSVDTTKINLGEQVDQVAEALKKHMEGPMGMYYQAAVRKTMVCGVCGVLGGVLFTVICILLGRLTLKIASEPGDLDCVFPGVASIASGIVAVFMLANNLPYLLATEYYAMNDILTKLGSIVN